MAVPFRVKAIYEYSSPHEDDLNFGVGQVITVTDDDEDDWYGGVYVDDDGVKKEGIFPRNFVERFEPTAPPRPTRARHRREPGAAPLPGHEDAGVEEAETAHKTPPADHASAAAPPKPAEPEAAPKSPPAAPKASEPPAAAPAPAPAPKPKPAPPPPVSEKPASNSFRDRIAAFNKPAAPPVAPFKPGGLGGSGGSSGFVKKPFVAPPPSRNAYVPPPTAAPAPTVYRREEDPEIREREAENLEQAEKAGLVPSDQQHAGAAADQPKPTSLKERIALLQKQQLEQAQRHAEAVAKKEKPKKPPKKRTEAEAAAEAAEGHGPATLERRETDDTGPRTSADSAQPARAPPAPRRKSSKGPAAESVHDGNEADMSGAGDTTEGQDDTTERDDSDETSRHYSQEPAAAAKDQGEEDDEEVEEEEEVDPEVRRKEELRARMAKMSGGMGFHGMFGAPMPPTAAPPKKKAARAEAAPAEGAEETSPVSRAAPPIPTPMALPGMGGARASEEARRSEEDGAAPPSRPVPPRVPTRPADDGDEDEDDEDEATTPAPVPEPKTPRRDVSGPRPVPGSRPAPPPVPSESRLSPPPPPPPPADAKSATEGSQSDDELSGGRDLPEAGSVARSPPVAPLQSPVLPARSPPVSPGGAEEPSPSSPSAAFNKRNSRPPPPIPGSAPVPPPAQSRPPPPPPPGGVSRQPTMEAPPVPVLPARPPQAGEEEDEEVTEYEGDYDTDIASSVPHKDALKAHAREPSLEDNTLQSPVTEAPSTQPPPLPTATAPRAAPPPIPTQHPPEHSKRRSLDAPRAAPPPPPPAALAKEARSVDDYDPYSYSAHGAFGSSGHGQTKAVMEEEAHLGSGSPVSQPERRAPGAGAGGRGASRQSMEAPRTSSSMRRSVDLHRPSIESGFIAHDVDLALQSGWWKQANQVPPALQGRRDVRFESDESTTTNQGSKAVVTREICVLFQDYSQTVLTVRYDPYERSDVSVEQRHEGPPRALRQDQMEEYHERFGRSMAEAAAGKKDGVAGDGTPQGLVLELLRPLPEALGPVGTRAYGALVYANMANASTQQHDAIRPGDVMTVRNARFQGKHGPMHAKYSAEVGKPDHVAVVAEWDGTKKKVRAWEQGRESKKVKLESFKLDDLRSGEVKIWRVVPRSWVGW